MQRTIGTLTSKTGGQWEILTPESERTIVLKNVPSLDIELGDIVEANVKEDGKVYRIAGWPLVIIPSTEKSICKLFADILRSPERAARTYRGLLQTFENEQRMNESVSRMASHWWSTKTELPGCTRKETFGILKLWNIKRNYRQLYLFGFARIEIMTYMKYAERNPYDMITDVMVAPTRIFSADAIKVEPLARVLGRVFWSRIHEFLRNMFWELQNGKILMPLIGLKPKEEIELEEMPVKIKDYCVYLNYSYSIVRDLTAFFQRMINRREQFKEKANQPFDIPDGLADKQKEAFIRAVYDNILLVTGSAGSGKTRLIFLIYSLLVKLNRRVSVGAYTGKAVANIRNGNGRRFLSPRAAEQFDPRTLHSLCKAQVCIDTLIIDEISMLNADLLAMVIRSHPEISQIIMLGDTEQLPPIGIGHLLPSLTGHAFHLHLDKTFRFEGDLLDAATAIRTKQMPVESENFKMLECKEDGVIDMIRELVDPSPDDDGEKPEAIDIKYISVVSPFNKCVDNINAEVQKLLQKLKKTGDGVVDRRGHHWNVGDRVIFLENNPDIGIWNGQEGSIIEANGKNIRIAFDGVEVDVSPNWGDGNKDDDDDERPLENFEFTPVEELTTRQIRLSYALTVHKAQGSEWDIVIFYLGFCKTTHFITRNLIYTAMTRARKSLFFLGSEDTLKRGLVQDSQLYPVPLEFSKNK